MFKRRKKRAAYRVCDYPDCLETATVDVEGGYACDKHKLAVARLARVDPVRGRYETRGGAA